MRGMLCFNVSASSVVVTGLRGTEERWTETQAWSQTTQRSQSKFSNFIGASASNVDNNQPYLLHLHSLFTLRMLQKVYMGMECMPITFLWPASSFPCKWNYIMLVLYTSSQKRNCSLRSKVCNKKMYGKRATFCRTQWYLNQVDDAKYTDVINARMPASSTWINSSITNNTTSSFWRYRAQ